MLSINELKLNQIQMEYTFDERTNTFFELKSTFFQHTNFFFIIIIDTHFFLNIIRLFRIKFFNNFSEN